MNTFDRTPAPPPSETHVATAEATDDMTPGQVAFEAYYRARFGVFEGSQMRWSHNHPTDCAAWEAAARAVIHAQAAKNAVRLKGVRRDS